MDSYDKKKISQAMFIYNALINGWSVKYLPSENESNSFEFKKHKNKIVLDSLEIKENTLLQGFFERFIKNNSHTRNFEH